MTITIEWIDGEREPKVAPNPKYPDGIDLDMSDGSSNSCITALPYPAPRCGVYVVKCDLCGLVVAITTAGRPDDPRTVKLPCKGASDAEPTSPGGPVRP